MSVELAIRTNANVTTKLFLAEKAKNLNLFVHAMLFQAHNAKAQAKSLSHIISQYSPEVQALVNDSDGFSAPFSTVVDEQELMKRTDAYFWGKFYQESNIAGLLDTIERKKWLESLSTEVEASPEFTFDNIYPTSIPF